MAKRIRVSDKDFSAAIAAVKSAIEDGDKSDPMDLLAMESGLTAESAYQRVCKLIRPVDMVEETNAKGETRKVNKGGWGVPREKLAFLFKASEGKGNRKDADEVRDLYLSAL